MYTIRRTDVREFLAARRPAPPPPTPGAAPVQPKLWELIPLAFALMPAMVLPVPTGIGAGIGALIRGRGGGAVGAVLGAAFISLPIAFVFAEEYRRSRNPEALTLAILAGLPTVITAATAGIGFAIGGPTGALIGALLPSVPQVFLFGGGILSYGAHIVLWLLESLVATVKGWFHRSPAPTPAPEPQPEPEPVPAPSAQRTPLNLVG